MLFTTKSKGFGFVDQSGNSENNVEVVSGVNLPMLLKLATLPDKVKLGEAVKIAEAAGRDNIIIASKLLSKRNNEK